MAPRSILSHFPSARRGGIAILGASILATAATGVALAAGSSSGHGYAACATSQQVLVLRAHNACPHGSHKVTLGAQGPSGQGPAIVVTHTNPVDVSSMGDTSFHSLATLKIPAKGSYIATSKVVGYVSGGSDEARSECDLVATTTASHASTVDESLSDLQNNATAGPFGTQSDQVAHVFKSPGTITLMCQQNGLTNGGASLEWTEASIIATKVSTLTATKVTH